MVKLLFGESHPRKADNYFVVVVVVVVVVVGSGGVEEQGGVSDRCCL